MALAHGGLWRNCGKRRWTAGFAPRSKHLINRLEHKQQWQFVLACGAVCHGRNGNQSASSSQGAFERWELNFAKNTECSSGRPPDLPLPRWSPELASLLEVVALRQLALPEVATNNRVAVLIEAIGEGLARHADDAALLPLQVALFNEISLRHKPSY